MKRINITFAQVAIAVLLAMVPVMGNAQYVRSTYFMEGAQYRLQLNPALAPDRGYLNLPVISHTGASFQSNALGLDDMIDVFKNVDDADYFTTSKFYDKLKDMNRAHAAAVTDLIAAGFWHGNSFMSFNVSVKADGNVGVPKEMFTFMRDMKGMNHNDYNDYVRDIGGGDLDINVYTELGFGYAHVINDHLTLGGRVKGLLGHGNVNLKMDKAVIKTHLDGLSPDVDWTTADPMDLVEATGTASVDVVANLESSAHGLDYIVNDNGYIDDVEFKASKLGVAGFGAAVDLGIEYNVNETFSLSAAITDLGFIRWSKGNTVTAHANTSDLNYDSNNPGDLLRFADVVATGKALNLDMMRLYIDEQGAKSRTTSLTSTLALGGQVRLLENRMHLGALYTNRFSKPGNQNELTLSFNYHPQSLLDFTVSYSPIMCGGQSFGVAMKLGPLFIGTDYMFLGKDTKCCNALVGISVPLGARMMD